MTKRHVKQFSIFFCLPSFGHMPFRFKYSTCVKICRTVKTKKTLIIVNDNFVTFTAPLPNPAFANWQLQQSCLRVNDI